MKVVAFVLAITGCGGSCGLDLERMIDQPRYTTYEACDVCPDGTIMMQPPVGVVARSAALEGPEIAQGRSADGKPVTDIPITVDAPLLVRGKNRFDIFCAACHGRLGNGASQVAENMTLRWAANLLVEPVVSRPPGYVYAVVTDGFGMMRSYAGELPVRDRWAVVAYLQVLQLSQHVALGELPAARQQEAKRWLK